MAREIGADRLPALPLVGRPEQQVRAGVHGVGIVPGDHDREGPLEPILHVLGARAHRVLGIDRHVALLSGAVVETADVAVVAAGVVDVGLARLGRDVAALAAAGHVPVAGTDAGLMRA